LSECGGVTKEHYRQMVQLDESNIEIQWHCPPCEKLENPNKPNPVKKKKAPSKKESLKGGENGEATRPLSVAIPDAAHIPRPGPTPPLARPRPTDTVAQPSYNRVAMPPANSSKPVKTTTVPVRTQPVKTTVVRTTVVPIRTTVSTVRTQPVKITVPVKPTVRTTTVPVTNARAQNGGRSAPGRLSFPDCKIRDLPFFPVKATLLRPCNLTPKDASNEAQQQNLAFYLTQEQANTVNNGRKVETNGMVVYKMHILLRFTKMAPDNVHDDDFPKNLCLKVNNKICPLPNPKPVPANRPNMEAKRPPKPLIITSLCKLNTKSCLNQISITWTPSEPTYTVSIYLVEKLGPGDLLESLKGRGQRDPQITEALIRSKLEDKDSDEIATTSCKVTMACPLGMARMTYPARAATCDHLQCFDVDTYLRMNEKKPKWLCPVCNKPAYFENLFLDGFYIQLLQSPKFRALSTNDIVLNQDATWEPVISDGVGVSDDSEDDEDPLSLRPPPAAAAGADPDIIPIIPDAVDADGAPILSQLAALPIAPLNSKAPSVAVVNGGPAKPAAPKAARDEDFLSDGELMPEDDFMDWNMSVKFFNFIRIPPVTTALKPTPVAMVEIPPDKPDPAVPVPAVKPKQIRVPVPAASKPRGGGGRGSSKARGGGGRATKGRPKRNYDSDDLEYDSHDEPEPPKKKQKAKPKPKPKAAATKGRAKAAAAPKRAPRYRESSGEEESSENEEEVLKRPVVQSSSRPSRNCRRSTNYADIEKSGDVLDFLLN